MPLGKIAFAVALLVNGGALAVVVILFAAEPPRMRDPGDYLLGAALFAGLSLNVYVCLVAWSAGKESLFGESLLGLWIRTKKQKLRRELDNG